MRIFLTGCTGFLGKSLLRFLSDEKDLKNIELGTINQNPQVTNYHLTQLGVSYNDFVNLKNKYCQFN